MNQTSTTATSIILMLGLTALMGCGKETPANSQLIQVAAKSKSEPAQVGRRVLSDGVVTEVLGLRVVKPFTGQKDLRAFNWNPGTSVAVAISLPQGGIIGLDREASKITAFYDNKGTDLWDGPQVNKFSHSSIDMMPSVSEDTRAILLDVDGQGVPKSGAKSLTLKGEMQLWVSQEKTKLTASGVNLKEGTKFTLGSRKIKVTKSGTPKYGNKNAFSATLRLKGEVADIAEIKFFDAQGNDLSGHRQSSFWSGDGERRVSHWEFVFEQRPKGPVAVVMNQWTDLSKKKIPLDLKFNLGL